MKYYARIFLCYFLVMFVGFLIPPFVFPYIHIAFLAEWGLEWQQSAFGRAFSAGIMYAVGMSYYHFRKSKANVDE